MLRPLVLALFLCSGAASVAVPAGIDDVETQALEELKKAEEHVGKGFYSRALDSYRRIARKYPETTAGKTAERRSQPNALLGWGDVLRNGPSANRLDVVVLGDGFVFERQEDLASLIDDIPDLFERQPIFKEYWSYLNFLRVSVVSEESGADGFGREYSTALDGKISSEVKDDPAITVDTETVATMLAELPAHDGLALVLVNFGGSGTFGENVATIGAGDLKPVMRGWGHLFGRLESESTIATNSFRGQVASAPNVSETGDPKRVPWARWIEAKVQGIGVHEGAARRLRGAWKPTTSGCVMDDAQFFCKVCREALVLRIYDLVDPIESCSPEPHRGEAAPLTGAGPHLFKVVTMRPESHAIEVRWWVLPEARAPRGPRQDADVAGVRPRGKSPALKPIEDKPVEEAKGNAKGEHSFQLLLTGLAPGRYRVVCRAKDTTAVRGEKWPWVLKDERGVLESERSWSVIVE